jgi:mRNA interferase RelE/StbE
MTIAWRVEIHHRAQRELESIPEPAQTRIINKLLSLSENPFPKGVLKLKGHSGLRLRVGDYHILYEADSNSRLIFIYAIRHRKEAYR